MRRLCVLLLAVVFAGVVAADDPKPKPEPKVGEPKYVDDDEFYADLMDGIADLADQKKCLPTAKLKAKMKSHRAAVVPLKAADKAMSPEEVARHARPSVFAVGSVYKDKGTNDWVDGVTATAWALAPDGVLVTNWHVFEDLEPGEVFGVADHTGKVYPVTDFLGGDKVADVAVIRVGGKGFAPLPLADKFAPVGSWVGVLGHPGEMFYVFTHGHVTRYSKNQTDDGKTERWMGLTAEFAGGSSGSPVLNDRGAVVGMAAVTITLDSGEDRPKQTRRYFSKLRRADPPDNPGHKFKDEPKPMAKQQPAVQMVVKMAVPAPVIREFLGD
jgi:S1-C subfamily serine protease